MRIVIESDRECTIDGVGLLKPGEPVEVDEIAFRNAHGRSPAEANFPPFVSITYDMTEEG